MSFDDKIEVVYSASPFHAFDAAVVVVLVVVVVVIVVVAVVILDVATVFCRCCIDDFQIS